MNLKKLLTYMPYRWKVQTANQYSSSLVAYLDSRDVQSKLDEVCGTGWQDKYYEVCGNLYCAIGIKCGEDWIWRTDCGTPSAFDKEKGQASDAFKRAAVKLGIGRFLYNLDIIKLKSVEKNGLVPNHSKISAKNSSIIIDLSKY